MGPKTGRSTSDGSEPRSDHPDRFRHLIEHVQDAVVEFELIGEEPVIRSVNPAFEDVFGYAAADAVGERLNDLIVPPWLAEEAAALDERTASGQVNYRRVRRQTAEGMGEFLYRGVPYADAYGFAVYTDLTTARRRERRLEVLNRLLRHNLRNTVNVVAGAAADAAADTDPATAELLESGADDLLKLTEEAAEIQRTLTESLPEDPAVDCVPLIESVLEERRERHPEADVRADLPDTLRVTATDRLRAAIDALVENALVHNDGDPTVWVCAEAARGEWADVVVADDGPEIPAPEREVVTGEAAITDTRHGTGLGLWLAKWTVERYGGTLSFGRSDAGGNLVRLRLYRAG
jgi:PAS domain S-box-containing protein